MDCETKPWALFCFIPKFTIFPFLSFLAEVWHLSGLGDLSYRPHFVFWIATPTWRNVINYCHVSTYFFANLFNVSCSTYFENLIEKNHIKLCYSSHGDFSLPQIILRRSSSPMVASASLSSLCALLSLAAVAAVSKAQGSVWDKPEGRYSSSAGAGLWSCATPELSMLWKSLWLYGNIQNQEVSLDEFG